MRATEAPDVGDRATQVLVASHHVHVTRAGQYVETGTFRIQVSTSLGQPSTRLPDGTWLYRNYTIEGSGASGTLVVSFFKGRVSEITLVEPTLALAMISQQKALGRTILAGGD